MSVEALQQWIQQTYGRRLNDAELSQLAEALNYTGGPITPDLFAQAQSLVEQAASAAGIPPIGGPEGIPAPGGPETPGGNAPRTGGNTPAEAMTTTDAAQALKEWATSLGYTLTDAQIGQIAQGVGFTGGMVSPDQLQAAKDWATANVGALYPDATPNTLTTPGGTPGGTGGNSGNGVSAFNIDEARQAVIDAVKTQYAGYNLNDDQLQFIWENVSKNGVVSTQQMVSAAMAWLGSEANRNSVLAKAGNAGGGGGTGGTVETVGSGTGGGTGGGNTATIQNLDTDTVNLLKIWWQQTFRTDPTDAQLVEIARRVNYTGGPITPKLYAQIQGTAETLMREGGWTPPTEPELENYLPTFSYEDFQFGEQAPAGYQAGPAFTPGAFTYGEQEPGAFDYREFEAPRADDVLQDPAYQRRLEEGRKALETSAAAKGLLRTGATLKSLSDYAQQQASDEYARTYQRQLGEYQMGRAGAKEEFESGRQSYMDRYNKAYQEYLTNLENERFGYTSSEQQRRSTYDQAQREYDRKYKMAQDKYQTGYNKAFAEYQSRRSAAEQQYQQDWNYWKYLQEQDYRRAALNAGLAT